MQKQMFPPPGIPSAVTRIAIIAITGVTILMIGVVFQPFDAKSAFAEDNNDNIAGNSEQVYGNDENETDEEELQYESFQSYDIESATTSSKYVDDLATGYENSFLILNVLANDREMFGYDEPVFVESVSAPSFGTATINSDNTITYTPYEQKLPLDSIVSDTFQYFAVLGDNSNVVGPPNQYNASVHIQIIQINDTPIVYDSEYTTSGMFSSYLSSYDQDGDQLLFSVVSKTSFGEIEEFDSETGRFQYVPYYDFVGYDSFSYTAYDGISESAIATVKIRIVENLDDPDDGNVGYGSSGAQDDGAYDSNYEDNDYYSNGTSDTNDNDDATSSSSSSSTDSNTQDSSNGPIPTVNIDILPDEYPNDINTNKDDQSIPVAILGSSSLDVSMNIIENSVRFGSHSARATSFEISDTNGDGFDDLIGYFKIGEIGLSSNDTGACMTGSMDMISESVSFNACDSVRIINKNTGNSH